MDWNSLLRVRDAELFNLGELVNAEDAPDIFAVLCNVRPWRELRGMSWRTYSTSLLAEASRVPCIPEMG